MWKQWVIAPDAEKPASTGRAELLAVLCLAVAAALAIKVPALSGLRIGTGEESLYFRNASLFVFPRLAVYFLLFVNLAWSAWLYARFLRHWGSFGVPERWQIAYLPVYSVWAALVVVMFPPVFGYR